MELRLGRPGVRLKALRCSRTGRGGRGLAGLAFMAWALVVTGLGCAVFPAGDERPKGEFSGPRVLQTIRDWKVRMGADGDACPSVPDLLGPPLRAMGASIEPKTAADFADSDGAAVSASSAATVAILKGTSADPILLIAPYTENCPDPQKGLARVGSAAFLLELGRVLSKRPKPYSIWLVFIRETGRESKSTSLEDSPQPTPWREVERLATRFEQAGVLDRVRVAVFFDGLGDPDAAALRDSHSHPIYREVFWESARDLGETDLFPPDAGFESSRVGHHALIQKGLRRTVMVTAGAGTRAPAPSEAQDVRGRAEAFQSVGDVSLEAISRIQTRLARMDQFSGSSRPQ